MFHNDDRNTLWERGSSPPTADTQLVPAAATISYNPINRSNAGDWKPRFSGKFEGLGGRDLGF
ncbi:MAG: hypothetical protein WBB29_22270 [Geitlerinemataceae cyanobacterium]